MYDDHTMSYSDICELNSNSIITPLTISFVYHMADKTTKTDQYQIRLSHVLREQLETEMRKDGDASLATWIKRLLRKELQTRGIEPRG